MHEKVQQYVAARKADELKEYVDEKRKFLLNNELYEKVYYDGDGDIADFPFSEWDSDLSAQRHYKRIPLEVSDEEYEEMKKYTPKSNPQEELEDHNPIATVLLVVALIIFGSFFILGIILGVDRRGDLTIMAPIYWGCGLITGVFYLGLAEIIKLLTQIKNK